MKICLLVIGKTDADYIRAGIEEYEKRLRKYVGYEMKLLPDVKNTKHMSETLQKQVFGSFLRKSEVENTEESRYAGAGQGLSMAGELLGLLGGTMELESKEGEGSKFTLRISFRIDPVFENKVLKRNIQTR